MVATAMIPRLCKMIAGGAFDPYSERCVRRAVEVTKQAESFVGSESPKFEVRVIIIIISYFTR